LRDGCLFCAIAEGAISCEIVDEDAATVSFLEMNPATPGHSIVIPRGHSADLREIESGDFAATMAAAQRLAVRAVEALGADGVNLLNCSGEAAWQTVPHFHVHVVPRYSGDPLQLPWLPVRGVRGDLAVVAARLREGEPGHREPSGLSLGEAGRGGVEPPDTDAAGDQPGPSG
jgi:histidine triad (HIT) family protein